MKTSWSRLAAMLALPAMGAALLSTPAFAKPPVVIKQPSGISGAVQQAGNGNKPVKVPGAAVNIPHNFGTPIQLKLKPQVTIDPGKLPPVRKKPIIPLIPGVVIKPKPFIPIDPGFVDPEKPKIPLIPGVVINPKPFIPIDPGFNGPKTPKIPKIPLIPIDPGFNGPKIPKFPIIPIDPGIGNGNPGGGNGNGNGNGGNNNSGGPLDWDALVQQILLNWLNQPQGGNLGDIVVVPFPVGGGPVVVGNGGGVVVGQPQLATIDLEVLDVRFVDDGDVAQGAGPRFRISVRHVGGQSPAGKAPLMLIASPNSKPSQDSIYATAEVDSFVGGMATVDVRLPLEAAVYADKLPFLTAVVGAPQGRHDIVPANNVATFDRSLVRDVGLKLHSLQASPEAGGVIVAGEGFGREVGTAYLKSGDTKVPLQLLGWQPTAVLFAPPAVDASCPHAYQLYVVRADGRVAEPLEVQF
jgi:hypothetical protein